MHRRLEIENIIIGTIVTTYEGRDYFRHCRYCITPDMFSDEVNRRLYIIVSEMYESGRRDINPLTIMETYGDKAEDIMVRMVELSTDFDFMHMKTMYNERQYLIFAGYGIEPKYTNVQFTDYINRFISLVFNDKQKGERDSDNKDAAA